MLTEAFTGAWDVMKIKLLQAALGNFRNRLFSHTKNQEIRFSICQQRRPEFILLVIIMNKPPKRGLDAAENYWGVGKRCTGKVGVQHTCSIRAVAIGAILLI